jgi:YD repeat-containing protein
MTAVAVTMTMGTVVLAYVITHNQERTPSNNPWDYTLFTTGEGQSLKSISQKLDINGDIRSNSDILLNGNNAVKGFGISAGSVVSSDGTLDVESKIENAEIIEVPNVWENVYGIASSKDNINAEIGNTENNTITFDNPVISDNDMNINVSADVPQTETENSDVEEKGKLGVFGAGFLTKVYENPDKWSAIFSALYVDSAVETDETGKKDLISLAENSNFIPVQEQSVGDNWGNYENLPANVLKENFNPNYLPEYLNELKKENPVFSVNSENAVVINGNYDNSTVNPADTAEAEKIVTQGGNFALNGNYENLEEIKIDSWGGSQLVGNYPNLKYIYKTTWGNLNLAGNFPSLECIYMPGGQLLLGSGIEGFNGDNITFINEYGSVIIYTAKDTTITNSSIVSTQNIAIRGAGKNSVSTNLNLENTVVAANNGLIFEDINDNNQRRYENIPLFYSSAPISLVNCNFELLQGAFITRERSIIMATCNIDIFRGFIFSPEGINEWQASSSIGVYIDTYSYNVATAVNSLNIQPTSYSIGQIKEIEYADFPVELTEHIGNAENFLAEISEVKNEDNTQTEKFILTESDGTPGTFYVNSYLLSETDININADNLKNTEVSVIGSENGNIQITVNNTIDFAGIIYAPNGKVTINVKSGTFNGRIFAQEIEINSENLVINGGNEDISDLGFVVPKPVEETTTVNSDGTIETTDVSESETTTPTTTNTSTPIETQPIDVPSDGNTENYSESNYQYDKLGRLIKVVYDAENYIEYEYDSNGNITKITTVKDGVIQ